jgi:hypothetical protein
MDTAWTILEAANDLGDGATVELCRRVIDTALRGGTSAPSDINAVVEFLNDVLAEKLSSLVRWPFTRRRNTGLRADELRRCSNDEN